MFRVRLRCYKNGVMVNECTHSLKRGDRSLHASLGHTLYLFLLSDWFDYDRVEVVKERGEENAVPKG